jgi:hypothetical protein
MAKPSSAKPKPRAKAPRRLQCGFLKGGGVPLNAQETKDPLTERLKISAFISAAINKRRSIIKNGCEIMVTKAESNKNVNSNHAFLIKKRIGSNSNSRYGEAYQVSIIDHPNINIAVKVMPHNDQNIEEVNHYKTLKPYILRQETPHFPIIESVQHCDNCTFNNKNIKRWTKDCFYVFNELAESDLKTWVKKDRSEGEYISMIAQVSLALAKLNSIGYKHNDLHWGNLLYHACKAEGYWHYEVTIAATSQIAEYYPQFANTKWIIYIKNTGQQWVLWDFGFAEKFERSDDTDFDRILNLPAWIQEYNYSKVPQNVQDMFDQLHYDDLHSHIDIRGACILHLIRSHSLFKSPAVYVNRKPDARIINKKPYTVVL